MNNNVSYHRIASGRKGYLSNPCYQESYTLTGMLGGCLLKLVGLILIVGLILLLSISL